MRRQAALMAHGGPMGAWGSGIFDNDTAMDWLAALTRQGGWGLVAETFDQLLAPPGTCRHAAPQRVADLVASAGGYDALQAVAALEAVAAGLGSPDPDASSWNAGLTKWVARHPLPRKTYLPALAHLTAEALVACPDDASWVDGGVGWARTIQGLEQRLRAGFRQYVGPAGARCATAWGQLWAAAPNAAGLLLAIDPALGGVLPPASLMPLLESSEPWHREIGVRATAARTQPPMAPSARRRSHGR
jgi:hypothetical protein